MNPDKIKTINCSDCSKSLIHYFIFQETDKINKILCMCPFCGGSSFENKIVGNIYYGPISSTENQGYSTVIQSIEEKYGLSVIHLMKGNNG